jgi:hypothetical protein
MCTVTEYVGYKTKWKGDLEEITGSTAVGGGQSPTCALPWFPPVLWKMVSYHAQ